jgi:hypothetical protein
MLMHSCLTVFTLLCANVADEKTMFSGPQKGEMLPPLKVSRVYGTQRGEVVDFIVEANGRPTLLVVVNGSNRPAARLTRALINYSEMQGEKLFAAVVYLDKDRSAAEEALQRAVSWWGMGPPVGISVDGAEGPGSYGLNRNVNLTVLVANKSRVTANFALVQPSETDAPKILKEVVSLVGGKIPSEAEVVFLSVPTRKPDNVPWRSAPQDVTLRRLICAVLAAEDHRHAATAAAAAVEEYVKEKPLRQAVLGNAAAVLSQGRTRIRSKPAVKYLTSWRKRYDPRM